MQEYVDTQLPGTMLNAGTASGLGHSHERRHDEKRKALINVVCGNS